MRKLVIKSFPMYLYATEMVSSYYSKLKIKDKNILTICGSGDQVLNAYFFNAKKVIGFDINERSEFITILKITAIKKFSYREYLDFFGINNKTASFDYILYKRIRENLNKKIREFFDNLYEIYNFNGKKLTRSDYFHQRGFIVDPKLINSYLKNERNYLKLREMLKFRKFEFVRSDVKIIFSNKKIVKEKFDIINLSNLPNYFVGKLVRENVKDPIGYFFNKIIMELKKKLSKKGKIFYYSYSPKSYPNKIAKAIPLFSKEYIKVKKVSSDNGFKIYTKQFKGLSGYGVDRIDKITVLEKN